jgi:hypothetical protein
VVFSGTLENGTHGERENVLCAEVFRSDFFRLLFLCPRRLTNKSPNWEGDHSGKDRNRKAGLTMRLVATKR